MNNFLVHALPPAATGGIRMPTISFFETRDLARAEAERLLTADYTNVSVWKYHSSPSLSKAIAWDA